VHSRVFSGRSGPAIGFEVQCSFDLPISEYRQEADYHVYDCGDVDRGADTQNR